MSDQDLDFYIGWLSMSEQAKYDFSKFLVGSFKKVTHTVYINNGHFDIDWALYDRGFSGNEDDIEFISRLLDVWRRLVCKDSNGKREHSLASGILVWFMLPDDAEDVAGWLIEEKRKLSQRHNRRFVSAWSAWALFWIIVSHILEKLRERTVIGRFLDALVRRIGG